MFVFCGGLLKAGVAAAICLCSLQCYLATQTQVRSSAFKLSLISDEFQLIRSWLGKVNRTAVIFYVISTIHIRYFRASGHPANAYPIPCSPPHKVALP